MKGAFERNDALLAGSGTGEFQSAFHRFGAGVTKENGIEMRRGTSGDGLCQEPAQKRAIHLHHVGQIQIENVADRFLHNRMVAANVENRITAKEIQVGVIIHVVEISAFSPGIDLVETNDALGRDQGAIDMSMMQLVIFAEPRCNDFFQVKRHSRTFSDLALKSKRGYTGISDPGYNFFLRRL